MMENITYHYGSSETALKNGLYCAKITKTGTYQRGCRGNRVGMAHTNVVVNKNIPTVFNIKLFVAYRVNRASIVVLNFKNVTALFLIAVYF